MTLLTPAEAAAMLRVSVDTVYVLVRTKRLECVRIGRSIKFSRRQLMRFVERQTVSR